MPSGSLVSLADAAAILDQALEAERGLMVEFSSHGALVNFRQRCHSLRSRERKHSRDAFAPGHPNHNTSGYDCLRLFDASTKGELGFKPPFALKIVKLEGMLPPEVVEVKEL